ncbi:formimidoylglutamate deiminase [Chryseolinea sp. T2]|uniref:formimidoylglutamate deiminase n=1 Tax=Chryseolinea sp. T2 TaxID=3129255 RepID=UPI003076E38B
MRHYKFSGLRLAERWIAPAYVGVDEQGLIQYLSSDSPDATGAKPDIEVVDGYALPGFRNAHSHAFQYAMAGKAERHAPGASDDFWTWREAMYGCALAMRPDAMEAIATMLYAEMLRNGYTHVVEFHYLHHDERGRHYAHLAEMGERLVAAAAATGIKITLVPVWYQLGDFGTPPFPRQRRFICESRDHYFKLLDATRNFVKHNANARLGFGVHSLRAVEAAEVIATFNEGPKDLPFHLHVSEQLKEVETSLMFQHARPVEWLLEHLPVDSRFHLVHCTHLTDMEVNKLARSGAHVVLCPGTEGNLGDGIFRLSDFARAGGKWSIGTDSQISLNPLEDLRWLDYVQRLITHRRNTFDDGAQNLIHTVWHSGNRALANVVQSDYFNIGQPLDAVVYDASAPLISAGHANQRLSSILYTSDSSAVLGTIVNGKWVVENGKALNTDKIRYDYEKAMRSMVW